MAAISSSTPDYFEIAVLLPEINTATSCDDKYIISEEELQVVYDNRSTICKIVDFIISFFREIIYGLSLLPGIILSWCYSRYDDCSVDKEWKENSEGLYVLVHGLKSHPATWDGHRSQLMEEQPNHDLFIPYVPHNGNCTLEDAGAPILEKILSYAQRHPDKPICLIGTSNGGRIVDYLEVQLRDHSPHSKVMVSAIAGVHYGSTKMTAINENSCLRCISGLHETIAEELSFGSEKAKNLLDAMQAPLATGTSRKYVFYASTDDILATSMGTTLPKIGEDKDVSYNVLHGYGHCALISAVRSHQLQKAQEWMQAPDAVETIVNA